MYYASCLPLMTIRLGAKFLMNCGQLITLKSVRVSEDLPDACANNACHAPMSSLLYGVAQRHT